MGRARETAELIGERLGMAVTELPYITELRESRNYATMSAEEQKLRRWSVWMAEHGEDPDFSWQGGESFDQVRGRVRRLKDELERELRRPASADRHPRALPALLPLRLAARRRLHPRAGAAPLVRALGELRGQRLRAGRALAPRRRRHAGLDLRYVDVAAVGSALMMVSGSSGETWVCSLIIAPSGGSTGPSSSGSSVSRIQLEPARAARPASPRGPGQRRGCRPRWGRRAGRRAAPRGRPARPSRARPEVLAGAVVAVGEHRVRVVVEAADVLPALACGPALRLVGGVVGDLGEDRLVEAVGLAAHQRHQGLALQPRRAAAIPASSQIVG